MRIRGAETGRFIVLDTKRRAAYSIQLSTFPPGPQVLRKVRPQAPAGRALDSALSKLTDIKLPTPQDLFPGKKRSAETRRFLRLVLMDGNVYLREPISPYEIKAGSIIPAALITGLNGDLPRQIIGQVTEPVMTDHPCATPVVKTGRTHTWLKDTQLLRVEDES